ncbi:GGDEF and EAL domain-containing protein [Nitratiruptor sp. SB155-2]|uniref:GGDEF and EAL domain-containing protein n=1 Tax=Nitratiruptor sp. (strain SB155-2) TaxID=387092 RepID=UPI0001586CFE|nr:GGDEF and EAL domain-containing protein [Nitratiruptor sp. SB155-2]BAF69632.1 signal transduction response regulator [Nitratiruptor sp. SB155-2]
MKTSRYSLAWMIRATILLAIVVLFVFQTIIYFQIRTTLQNIEEQNIKFIIQENLRTIAPLAYFHFDDELQKTLQNIQTSVSSIKKLKIAQKPIPTQKNQSLYPIQYKNQKVGYLFVEYDYEIMNQFFKKFDIYFTFFTLLLLALGLIFARYINKKIDALYTFSSQLSNIDIRTTKQVKPTDEYLELIAITRAINKMLHAIHLYIQKIKQSEMHLAEAQKIANMSSWEYIKDSDTFFCSDQLYRILGLNMKERLDWEHFLQMIDPQEKLRFIEEIEEAYQKGLKFETVVKFYTPKGEKYLKNVIKVRKKHNRSTTIIGIAIDVTEEIKAKKQVEFLAYNDPLTSLPNRVSFQDILEKLSKIAQRSKERFALIFLDIDNFKFVNDTYGHEIGDKLLIDIATILKETLRSSDLIFRIGGDEFVVLIPKVETKDSLDIVLEKIKESVAKEYRYGNINFSVSCSLGIAIFPDDSDDIETLTRYADIAMYEAKKSGKNRFVFFKEEMKKYLDHLQQTTQDLRKALKKEDELTLFFQPKIDIQNNKVIGAEALIRWNHPQKGLLTPNVFIPVAERSDLIEKIDEFVIKKSFRHLQEWSSDKELQNIVLSLNISARQFRNPKFLDFLDKNLKLYNIDPSKLELEITETLSMENVSHTVNMLEAIKQIGFQVALDDFGTGYSSLNYLKRLPFDTIKIDKSFIDDIDKDPEDYQITKIITDIAYTFRKEIIAEGVETKQQERILKDLKCFYAQGYLYAKPLPLNEFKEFITSYNH